MDEAARTSGPAVDEPKRGPAQIREDIEQTREELGETVEALAAKTDVKARAKAKVQRITGARGGGPAGPSQPRTAVAKRDVAQLLRRRPELFGLVAALAAGVLVRSLAGR